MLDQRLRRRLNIETTYAQSLVFAGRLHGMHIWARIQIQGIDREMTNKLKCTDILECAFNLCIASGGHRRCELLVPPEAVRQPNYPLFG